MSDQIILEFIGDPSGLRPAEEALKGLSKTSLDTMEAFNKANQAAKKFAEGNKEASKSIKEIGDAAGKTVKAISTLTQAISGGAIKVISDDFKTWAKNIAELTIKKGELQKKISEVNGEIKKISVEVKAATTDYKALSKEADSLEGQIAKNTKAMNDQFAAAEKVSAKNKDLQEKLKDVKDAIAAMNGTSQEGSEKYNQLTAAALKLESQIIKNDDAFAKHAVKAIDLSVKNDELKTKLGGVQSKMDTLKKAIDTGTSSISNLGKESKTLTGELSKVDEKIDTANKKFGESSKAAEKSTKSINDLINSTKILISSMGEVSATMMEATGRDREANAIREKTAQVLSAVSTAQGIATAAMDSYTAATEIGTIATGALDVAMGPITLVMLGIATAAAAVFAGFKLFGLLKQYIQPIGEAVDFVSDRVRDFLNIFTSGFVDDAATNKAKENIRKIGEEHEQNSEHLKKQIGLMEAMGSSGETLAKKKMEQLSEEKASLEAQIKLEDDKTKQIDLQNKLDENAVELIKNKKSIEEAHLETMKKMGASNLEILTYKRDQVALQIKENEEAIKTLQIEMERVKNIPGMADGYRKMIEDMKTLNKDLSLQLKEDNRAVYKEANAVYVEHLENQKTHLEGEIIIAQKLHKDDFDLKMKLYAKEREIVNADATLSKEAKFKAFAEINTKEDDLMTERRKKEEDEAKAEQERRNKLTQEELQAIRQKDKEELEDNIRINQEKIKDEKLTVAEKIRLQKIVLADQMQMEIDAVNATEKTKEEKAKLIDSIISSYNAESAKLDNDQAKTAIDDKTKTEINGINKQIDAMKAKGAFASQIARKELDIINVLKKANEELHKKGLINDKTYADQSVELEKKTSAKKAEIKKADLALAKQIGQKLIEYAKQISDAIFENQKQKRDNELKEHIDTLNARKDAELLNTTLTASQRRAIEKKYKIEEAREKEKAWKADQKAKAEQAIINGLLAFTSALISSPPPMNYVNAAIALASAGVQAGVIMSKTPPKFAKGVVALEGPGTETSDSIAAYLSKGESVITAKATKKYAPLLEAMNAGTFTEYMPIPQMPDVTHHAETLREHSHTVIERLDYEKLGEAFARKVNLKQLNINLDEKGFSKSILSKGSRIESYNDKMKF